MTKDVDVVENAEYSEKSDEAGLAVVGADADDGEYEHKDVRKKVLKLLELTETSTWDLSVVLEDVYRRDLYRPWGFDSFKEYAEKELDMKVRWSQILVQLQEWYRKLPQNIQKWIADIGITKARMLMSIVTVENAAEWKKKIDGKSVAEIKQMLKDSKDLGDGGDGEEGEEGEEKAASKNFKLFPLQMKNVDMALSKSEEISGSDKSGNNLDLICTEFLATNAGVDSVQDHLRKMEKNLGVRLIAYVPESDSVVYGSDLISDLEKKDLADEIVGEAD